MSVDANCTLSNVRMTRLWSMPGVLEEGKITRQINRYQSIKKKTHCNFRLSETRTDWLIHFKVACGRLKWRYLLKNLGTLIKYLRKKKQIGRLLSSLSATDHRRHVSRMLCKLHLKWWNVCIHCERPSVWFSVDRVCKQSHVHTNTFWFPCQAGSVRSTGKKRAILLNCAYCAKCNIFFPFDLWFVHCTIETRHMQCAHSAKRRCIELVGSLNSYTIEKSNKHNDTKVNKIYSH